VRIYTPDREDLFQNVYVGIEQSTKQPMIPVSFDEELQGGKINEIY
jgi:hypothetical protein